jgi:cytidylate kinase
MSCDNGGSQSTHMMANNARTKTVAISRQRGSGGSLVARAVSDRLGLRYIDREMLRAAAEYLCGTTGDDQARIKAASWWTRLGEAFASGGLDCGYVPPTSESVYEGELFDIEKRLLLEIADEHDAVIVGRGAAQTLRGRTHVVSVFLHAPESWRIDRVQQVYRIADQAAACRIVRTSDIDRALFVRALNGADWSDAREYDLALDTAALGFDATADLIVRAVESQAQTMSGL